MPVPSSPSQDLRARLRAMSPHQSPAARKVVDALVGSPGDAAQLTVHQMAERAGTSPASVVRLARELGYAGYPQLRLALAVASAEQREEEAALGADVAADDDAETVVRKLAAFEAQQLRDTAEILDAQTVDAVARRCAAARRISVYGVGASGLVAGDLSAKFGRLGLFSQVFSAIDAALPDAALLGEDDVAIGISHSGESVGAVEPLRAAAANGARTVALTGRPTSTLTGYAEDVLLTAGREFGFRSAAMGSRTGQLLAGDAIFVRVAQLVPTARDALERTYESLRTSAASTERKNP